MSVRNTSDLERVQKSAVKIILNERDLYYDEALSRLNLDKLDKRREKLCLAFAKKCLKAEKVKEFFPVNEIKSIQTRNFERFKVNPFNTERYKNSSISYLQSLLNKDDLEKRNFIRSRGVK